MQEGWDVWGQWEGAAKIGCHNNSKATHSKANDAEDRLPTCLIILGHTSIRRRCYMFACSESESLLEGGREGGRDDGPLWCLSPRNLANSAGLWEPCTGLCMQWYHVNTVLHHHGMGSAVNMPNCTPGSEWDKRLLHASGMYFPIIIIQQLLHL